MVSSTTAGSEIACACFFVDTVFRPRFFFCSMSIDDSLATSALRASHTHGQYKTCVLRQCVERVWCSSFHDGNCAMCANCGRRTVSVMVVSLCLLRQRISVVCCVFHVHRG